MEVITTSAIQTKEFASKIAVKARPGDVYALIGDLGSGKTTFTRFFVEALGFESRVQSPTFVILRKYTTNSGDIAVVNHFDLYRIQSIEEIVDLGFEELITERNSISIIEWPELILDKLPKNAKIINFEYIGENERKITIQD